MIKNYFALNRLVLELNRELVGYTLFEAYSQEKDTLILGCAMDGVEKCIEISVNPGFPYFTLRSGLKQAKKNTVSFFEKYLPSEIMGFMIFQGDRVLRILFDGFSLFFTIRGKLTNVLLIDDEGGTETFKDYEEHELGEVVESLMDGIYLSTFFEPEFDESDKSETISELRRNYRFLGAEIEAEYAYRHTKEDSFSGDVLYEILHEIEDNKFSVKISEEKDIFLCPVSFKHFPADRTDVFDTYIEAQQRYIGQKYRLSKFNTNAKILKKHFDRELSHLAKRLNSLQKRLERGSKESEYSNTANLLLANIHRIKAGMKSIEVEDYYDEGRVREIAIKADKSPQQNIDEYFKKARSERIQIERSEKEVLKVKKAYDDLKEYENRFLSADRNEDLEVLMKELKLVKKEKQSVQDDLAAKFKQYVIDDTYKIYVGKDSQSNDLLTTRFAKQNDLWFHVRGMPGSHVVLRIDNPKETVPKSVLKKIAAITAYHSKAKTAGTVPVAYTFKKYVIKKKGMAAGKVALMKEDVLLVRPEIPNGCEYRTGDD